MRGSSSGAATVMAGTSTLTLSSGSAVTSITVNEIRSGAASASSRTSSSAALQVAHPRPPGRISRPLSGFL